MKPRLRACLAAAALLLAGGAALAAPRVPEARAGDFVVRVAQILLRRTATVAFGGAVADRDSIYNAPTYVYLQLDVTGKPANASLRVAGLADELLVLDEAGRPFDTDGAALVSSGPAGAAVGFRAGSGATAVRELRLVCGELLVYPKAERVRVEVPWPREGGASSTSTHGVRGMLRQASLSGTTLRLRFRVEVPGGSLGVDPFWEFGGDVPLRVLDASGNPLLVRGEVVMQPGLSGPDYQEYTLQLGGVSGAPARVGMDVVARTGTPRRVPFRLTGIALPEFSDTEDTASAGSNPYLDPESTSSLVSRVTVRGQPGADGLLLCGLSRQEPGGWGPWRWIETPTDAAGRATIENLKPGRYRISRQWRPRHRGTGPHLSPTPPWTNARVEVDVPNAREVALPTLELP